MASHTHVVERDNSAAGALLALFAVALILLLGALAYSRGWLGGTKEVEHRETVIENVVPSTPNPAPAQPAPAPGQ